MQTFNGPDTATLRSKSRAADSFSVFVEEESSSDGERGHTTEDVGYAGLYDNPFSEAALVRGEAMIEMG
jgi:hypothetical protein